mmetsp:Transcript_55315/g.109897  ORF Transcript_55315/g.109897 Transcript_55315/m.109897 type:complete len:289 (+) Transcript_55315:67-933(+)
MGTGPSAACACPGDALGPTKPEVADAESDREVRTGDDRDQEPVVVSVAVSATHEPTPPLNSGSYLPQSEIKRLVGDDVCAICLEPLKARAQTIALCGHVFHRCCLNRCGDILCPQCRQPIDEMSGTKWGSFTVGTLVTICGLQNHVELNGTRCRVVEIHEATHRLEVRTTEGGRLYRVRPDNLTVAEAPNQPGNATSSATTERETNGSPHGLSGLISWDSLEPGTHVRLEGLQTARDFNGRTAVILSTDRAVGRCEIRMEDGSVKTIRAENLRAVSEPSASVDAGGNS